MGSTDIFLCHGDMKFFLIFSQRLWGCSGRTRSSSVLVSIYRLVKSHVLLVLFVLLCSIHKISLLLFTGLLFVFYILYRFFSTGKSVLKMFNASSVSNTFSHSLVLILSCFIFLYVLFFITFLILVYKIPALFKVFPNILN